LAKPAYSFAAEPTLGFYRASAGVIALTGGQLRGGVPTGAVNMFIALPSSIGFATADTGKEYLELNGATYNTADYPALAAFLGAVGSTFTLPDMTTANRFPRARGSTLTVRTTQANTVGPHTHPDVTSAAETQEHTHSFSGTTGTSNQSLNHSHTYIDASVPGPQKPNSGGTAPFGSTQAGTTSAVDLSGHNHNFSGTTSGRSAVHNHVVSTPANTGTTETRPEAIAFVFAVKT
jgi:hypothetical protein